MKKPFYQKEISISKLENSLTKIKDRVYSISGGLNAQYAFSKEPVDFSDRQKLEYKEIRCGEKWGDLFDCAWFNIKGVVPSECAGKHTVLMVDLNGEGCLYDKNGVPVRGITNINSEYDRSLGLPGKRIMQFSDSAKGGESIDLWIDAGCNDLFGKYCGGTLVQADIAVCNDNVRKLYYDFWVLLDLLKILDENCARYASVLFALSETADILYTFSDEEVKKCTAILSQQLNKKAGDTCLEFYATGHAHLDLAWLWPMRETKRKALRTFSTAIEMLERYPYYIFGASQPQQFQWVKEQSPELYEKIKQKVKEGRIELQGAMWCEPDLNITGGESLVRQILEGKKFFQEEFGQNINIAHIPDVFGFNCALPQILKKSGLEYLLTIKMSWNKYNCFPYHTFNWQGIDGSEVLTHMPPEGSYNSAMAPRSVDFSEKNYIDKGKCDKAIILYGIGDGGGGPGSEHLERLHREQNLSGISKVKSSTTAQFFKDISEDRKNFATYKGEMYLEKHQGTYTTQAKNKYYNRKLELLLRDAEFFASVAFKKYGVAYPQDSLRKIWQEILLFQFHDTLPGSCIKRVYDESIKRYKELEQEVFAIISASQKKMNNVVGFNANSFKRIHMYKEKDNWYVSEIEPYSFAYAKESIKKFHTIASDKKLESKNILLKFNENGELTRYYDKKNKREVTESISNILNVYEDRGDAWDMEEGYLKKNRGKFILDNVKTYTDGPFAVREQILKYGNSKIKQIIKVNDIDTLADFDCKIDWQERFSFLKAEFNFDILSDYVNCNCQFGNIKRSTKSNNDIECAQDEICAHKYIDLSEGNYGVAILNDCKYGYNAKGNNIKISLLRSTEYPGEKADLGEHSFRYAIYPHPNAFETSDVTEKAYAYNTAIYNKNAAEFLNFVSDSCIIESIKKAENGNGIVVRLYEAKGLQGSFDFVPKFVYNSIYLTSIDEKILKKSSKTSFKCKPFEIVTLLVE